jgi:hypothetical protein
METAKAVKDSDVVQKGKEAMPSKEQVIEKGKDFGQKAVDTAKGIYEKPSEKTKELAG